MTRGLTIFVISCILIGCAGQKDQSESTLDKKINELKEKEVLETGPPSLVHSHLNDSSHAYHYFKDSLNDEKLANLTYHKFPMVRVYSFLALNQRRYPEMSEIVFGHLNDTALITMSNYDVFWTESIADLIIYEAFYSVKGAERDSLRDLIFYKHQDLGAFSHILRTCPGYIPYYETIQNLCKDTISRSTLMALASYRKESDVDYIDSLIDILDNKFDQFSVIEKFPHSKFKYRLENYQSEIGLDSISGPIEQFYYAVASYQDNWSENLFNSLILNGPENDYQYQRHLQEIMKATEKYDTSLYNSVRTKTYNALGEDTLGIGFFDFSTFNSWW